MGIKRKVWALPAIATVIFSLGLAVSVFFVNDALTSIQKTEQADYPALDKLKIVRLDVQGVADALKDAVSEGDKKRIEQVGDLAGKVRTNIRQLGDIPGQQEVASRLQKEFDAYFAPALSAARIMLEMEQGNPQEVVSRMQAAQKTLEEDLAKSNDTAQEAFKNGIASSLNNVRHSLTTNVLVAVVVILSLAVVSYFVVRAIWQQLGGEPEYAREIASAIAQGNLSIDIVVDGDNRRSILGELLGMKQRLEGMVSNIKNSTETIKLASSEIAQGNADLSARTESQASSLEETTASMGTLTDTVKQNADNARTANQLVQSASGVAVRGGQVVNEVVSTMGEIHQSADKIVEIISVIDGIAFQTNILALNAAVEAARAGEQGRGFAVVASEVRNLAQRSAAAAKEIKALIGDSVEKVNTGSRLVDEAGKTMEEIVQSVRRVTDIMAEIAGASQEQSTGIQEISSAIAHIDDMTQQNSALVEQAAAAAAALQEQANHLSDAVSVFRLSGRGSERDMPPAHLMLVSGGNPVPTARA